MSMSVLPGEIEIEADYRPIKGFSWISSGVEDQNHGPMGDSGRWTDLARMIVLALTLIQIGPWKYVRFSGWRGFIAAPIYSPVNLVVYLRCFVPLL
jgi:hypothetical protein